MYETLLEQNPLISRGSVYRCLLKNKINKKPEDQKDKAKLFKAYEPGYLHIDVTYLPKFEGQKWYLFVAIDRATRALYYSVYPDKTARSTRRISLINV